MVYQFGKTTSKRQAKVKPEKGHAFKLVDDDEPPVSAVQGIMPGSRQEWRVALALERLGFQYEFQKSISGGRRVRGGQVIDFWIYTAPYPTPCFIQGEYWHNRKTEAEDILKQERVQRVFKGQVMENLVIPERELSSVNAAYSLLRRRLIG